MQTKVAVSRSSCRAVFPEQIAQRVAELSTQIGRDYSKIGMPVCIVGILQGAAVFVADLVREIGDRLPVELQYLDIFHTGPHSRFPFPLRESLCCS